MSVVTLRQAREDECDALSDLARRAKAHWGYDAAFMAACHDELAVTPGEVRAGDVFVAEHDGRLAGMASLEPGRAEGDVELGMLFVEPVAMRLGIGRRLFGQAVAAARARGFRRLVIQGDPNAAPFYRAMGAVPAGERPSASIAGRALPLFALALA